MGNAITGETTIDSAATGSAGASSDTGQTKVTGQTDGQQSSAPSPINLTDDSLVMYPGSEKPVKFSTLRGLQGQFTKVSQNHARLADQYKSLEQRYAEREAELNRIRQAAGGGQDQATDFLSNLGNLEYLSGKEAVGIVQEFQGAIQVRDQLLLAFAKKLQEVESRVGPVLEGHTSSEFDRKIEGWRQQLDIPDDPRAKSFIRTLYLSYNPSETLDEEFPTILKRAWEEQEQLIQTVAAKRREAARRKAFVLPSRGGDGKANKSLDLAGKSPQEITDLMWPLVNESDE